MDRITSLEAEIAALRKTLHSKEQELYEVKKSWAPLHHSENGSNPTTTQTNECDRTLPKWAIERYSRQILLPEIGVPGQQMLCRVRVLIVGAGGLGCPAAAYLAGAGVGVIGIVDYDTVDLTNLHRQTLHGEGDRGRNKVDSAAHSLRNINSRVTIVPHHTQLDSSSALQIVSQYDVVLDCTDNVPTRYLLNDVCVLTKRPLISGSALKMEGQITIYGYKSNYTDTSRSEGPCYRCLFPTPPPAETVGSCSANGVLGPVTGLIGALQALEAIKYIVGHSIDRLLVGRMLLFDGEDTSFRTVKLRGPNPQCAACSQTPTITKLVDYEAFCQARAKEKDLDLQILPPEHRITAKELAGKLCQRPLLVDVRNENEFHMCNIDGAINYPIELLKRQQLFEELINEIKENASDVVFICRRGNDSQIVAQRVIETLYKNKEDLNKELIKDINKGAEYKDRESMVDIKVVDLLGGLHSWAKEVDRDFPIY